jgi:MoxR-like ATPase
MGVDPPHASRILTPEELLGLQRAVDNVFIHNALVDYAVRITFATREPAAAGLPDLVPYIAHGVSPRATLGMAAAARALAYLRGRDYVLPQDISDVAPDVLRHRVLLSYEALAEGVGAETVVSRVLAAVPPPRIAPSQENDDSQIQRYEAIG